MKSASAGTSTSLVEVTQISRHGLWLLAGGREYFLPHDEYPWFTQGSVGEVTNVKLLHGHHLWWPDLDVDLELDSIHSPGKYPLVYK